MYRLRLPMPSKSSSSSMAAKSEYLSSEAGTDRFKRDMVSEYAKMYPKKYEEIIEKLKKNEEL